MAASLTFNIADIDVEAFPIDKEGKRCKVNISSVNGTTLKDLEGKVESIVLTLLKNDDDNKKFSLSIKLNKSSNITSSTLNIPIYGVNKFIYNINNEDLITKLYKVKPAADNVKLTHILIIGTAAVDGSVNFTFTATKSIFVINATEPQPALEDYGGIFHNLLTIEEFLNLRYIDYFSFDNEKFNELYKGISQGGGGISKKIKK
jgi:hypothetical protein